MTKRDAFKFEIIIYPDISGNIPEGPAYGVCIGQVLRVIRNSSHVEDCISRTKTLLTKLKCKGYKEDRIKKTIKKCLGRHEGTLINQYKKTKNDIMKMLW